MTIRRQIGVEIVDGVCWPTFNDERKPMHFESVIGKIAGCDEKLPIVCDLDSRKVLHEALGDHGSMYGYIRHVGRRYLGSISRTSEFAGTESSVYWQRLHNFDALWMNCGEDEYVVEGELFDALEAFNCTNAQPDDERYRRLVVTEQGIRHRQVE